MKKFYTLIVSSAKVFSNNRLSFCFLYAFALLFINVFSQGQCLSGGCAGGSQYPSGTFSSNTNSWTTVSTAIFAGEYSVYSVTSGSTYEWSLCSADGGSASYDAQLTLINNSTLAAICYSDDYCDGNKPKIQWTANFTGTVRVLINQWNCVSNSSFTTIVWRCSSCSSGSAPNNDNCPNATSLTVSSSCTTTNGTVAGATQSLAAIACSGFTGNANDDVWYKFVATSSNYHTITVTGASNFDAVVDIRSGACNGTNIACADESGYGGLEIVNLTGLTNGATYYVRVYDYYSGIPSTPTFTICVTNANNCTPYYSTGTTGGDFINRVQLGSLDNTPAGTGGTSGSYYNDYYSTVAAPNLQAGTSQSLIVTAGTYGGQTIAAWIDYNNNNIFEAGEKIGEIANVAANASGTINFTIPSGTAAGNKRMRVRTVWSASNIDPCATYAYGEAEDYKINITAACNTPTTPSGLSTTGISTSGATLNWDASTGSSTITYYWAIGTSASVTYDANYLQRGTTTSTNSGALSGLSPGTLYYWTVKAVTSCNGTESSYATTVSFTTSCTTPSAPTSLNTTNVSTTSATLNWTASASGSPTINYYWAIGSASNVTYEANYLQRGIVAGTPVNVFSLNSNTQYWWTVKAVTSCNGSASSYPSAISFTTTTVPTPLITWNGNTSTDWNTANNWTPNQVPTENDNVIIPAGRPNYPVISTVGLSVNNTTVTNKCKSLNIDAGGVVTVDGSALYVYCSGDLNISGVFNHHAISFSDRFQINSGAVVKVKNGGYLNIGSSALSSVTSGTPGGTVNSFNDIFINAGQLLVEPGGTVYIQDELNMQNNTSSVFKQEGGLVSVAMSGQGSTTRDKVAVRTNCLFTILGGTFRVNGDADGSTTTYDAIWFQSGSNIDIQGGTIELLNGTASSNFTLTLANTSTVLNNLIINKPGQTVLLDAISNPLQIGGDLTISAGTFDANNFNITVAGNWTNNAAFTPGTGTVTFTGNGKQITGTVKTTFNNLTFSSGSSYTINPVSASPNERIEVNNTFLLNANSSIDLANGKKLSLFSSTNTFNGTVTTQSAKYNSGTTTADYEIFIRRNNTLAGSGNIGADILFYRDAAQTSVTTLGSNLTVDGSICVHSDNSGATLSLNGNTLNIYGSITNAGTFNEQAGSSTVNLYGSGRTITGTAGVRFYHLNVKNGANYSINPSGVSWPDNAALAYGNFNSESGSALSISSGKMLDLYGSSVIINGSISATDAADATRDIDINNTTSLSGSGNTTADLRIFGGTTTLTSNFILNGNFEIRSGAAFIMSNHTFSTEGWKNSGTFTSGTGTVKFIGSGYRTVDANGNYNGNAKASADFYNVTIDRSADTLSMFSTPMRVANDFTIESGIFSTGWKTVAAGNDGHNRRLTVVKIATIKQNGTFFIGYQRACGAAGENLPCGNSDSLNIPVFRGDLINFGAIKTNRPIISGFSDLKLTGARIMGTGTNNEFGVDIQPEDNTTVTQVGHVDIQGDLIIQDPVNNRWECLDPNNILTIRGHLYIYGNFTHYGTVNLYGNMTSSTNTTETININSSEFNFYQSGATRFIYLDKNPIAFGTVNVIAGSNTRELRQHITVEGNLTLQSGTFDMYSSNNSNITLSGSTSSWINNATFTPRLGRVSFTGNGTQNMGGTNSTSFYNLTINKGSSSEVVFGNSATVSNNLNLTAGYVVTTPSKLLTLANGSSLTYPASPANSFVRGPMKKTGATSATTFIFPVGKNSRSARIAVTPNATSATNEFTAEYFENQYPSTTPVASPLINVSTKEYWQLDRGGASPVDASVTLYWEDAAWSGITSCAAGGDLVVAKWTGATWEDRTNSGGLSGSCSGSSAGTVASNTVTSFSPFTFGSKSSAVNPLPVELISFSARLKGEAVNLFWQTANEINNDFFTVERSVNLEVFETVSTVKGAGNSSSANHYSVDDLNPYEGISYYRLKQTDFDGRHSYSNIVPIAFRKSKFQEGSEKAEQSMVVYPNPGNGLFFVNVTNGAEGVSDFMVFDLMGRQVHFSRKNLSDGNVLVPLDLQYLQKGAYILVVQSANGKSTQKIIIQK